MPIEPDGDKFALWWTFDGLTELEDRSFYGHKGEINGGIGCGILAEGVYEGIGAGGNMCMKFDGVDRYIRALPSDHLKITGRTQWSIFIRFKVDNPSTLQVLFEKFDDLSGQYAYKVLISNGRLVFLVKAAGVELSKVTASSITANTWIDAWFVYSSQTLTIYVNGVANNTNFNAGGFKPTGFHSEGFDTGIPPIEFEPISLTSGVGTSLVVGVNTNLTMYFKGYIQDFRFWKDKAVTSTEVTRQFTNKVSISNIDFERIAVIGYGPIRTARKRKINETWSIGDTATPTYLPTNPFPRTISEPITFDDNVTPAVNVITPVNTSDNFTFSDAISITRGTTQVKVGSIVKSTRNSGLPYIDGFSEEVGFTPKFIMFWGSGTEAFDRFHRDPRFFLGFSDGVRNRALCFSANDATSTTDSAKGLYASAVLNVKFDNTVEVETDCTFTSNGFDLKYTVNNSNTARVIHYIAFGGSTITNVKVDSFTQPLSATGQFAVTSPAFDPDLVLLLPTELTALNSKSVNGAFWFGAFNRSLQQFSFAGTDISGVTTSVTRRISRPDFAITMLGANTTGMNTIMKSAVASEITDNGFILDYDTNVVSGATAGICAYAAIKGLKCIISSFNVTAGSTGIQVIENPDMLFKPSLIIFMGHGRPFNTTTPITECKIGIGAATNSLNRRADTVHIEDNETSSMIAVDYARSSRTFLLIEADPDAESSDVTLSIDFLSSAEGVFTIKKTTNILSANCDIHYIAIA